MLATVGNFCPLPLPTFNAALDIVCASVVVRKKSTDGQGEGRSAEEEEETAANLLSLFSGHRLLTVGARQLWILLSAGH